jgi:iron complex outermembrane receptor protein
MAKIFQKTILRCVVTTFAFPLFLFGASPAGAQQEIEEVIVTAQKREENVQDIGISITALNEDELKNAGIYDVSRVNYLVPGVNYAYTGNDAKFNVRGANSTNTFSDNSSIVGTYVDGVYKPRASQTTASFFDVERLEFLMGPQGTLYGRNTLAGAMNLHTYAPNLEAVSGGLDVSYAEFNTTRWEGFVNVPLGDQFGLRVAAYTEKGDGFVENDAGANLGNPDDVGLRISGLWQATENLDFLLRYQHVEKNGRSAGIFGYIDLCANLDSPGGFTDHLGSSNTCESSRDGSSGDPGFSDEYKVSQDYTPDDKWQEDVVSLIIDWDVGPVAIQSITSYTDFTNELQMDFDMSAHNVQPGGFDEYAESITQELVFSSNYDSRLQWTAGLYASKDETEFSFQVVNVVETFPRGAVFYPGTSIVDGDYNLNAHFADFQEIETDALGVFGQLEFSLTDDLRLIGGLRYNDEEKTLTGGGSNFSGADSSVIIRPGFSGDQGANTPQIQFAKEAFIFRPDMGVSANDSWDNTSWKASAEWDMNDNAMLYLTGATGFLSGSMAGSGASTDEQESEMWELGFKSVLLDGNLLFNLAAYYTEYTNLLTQTQELVGTVVVTSSVNGGEIETTGLELSSAYILNDWRFDLKMAYMDAEFGDFGQLYPYQYLDGVDVTTLPDGDFIDVNGETPGWSPDLTVALGVSYLWNLGNGSTLTPDLRFYYSDEFATSNLYAPDQNLIQDSYTKTDFALTWRSSDDKYSLAAFVENIEDEAVLARSNNSSTDSVQSSFLYPRNAGVRFTVRWN